MNRLASSRLLSLLPLLAACAMPVGEGDASSDAVRAAEQPLSAAERRERAALIRDLFAEQGITQGWLAEDALIIWEESADITPPKGLTQIDERRYGDTVIRLLEYTLP